MIDDLDNELEEIVRRLAPGWTELRVQKSRFVKLDEYSFAALSIMLAGKNSLLCCMDAKNVPGTIGSIIRFISRRWMKRPIIRLNGLPFLGLAANPNSTGRPTGSLKNQYCGYWLKRKNWLKDWGQMQENTF
jgi:hypothetical protein